MIPNQNKNIKIANLIFPILAFVLFLEKITDNTF